MPDEKQQRQAAKSRATLVAHCEEQGFPAPSPEYVFCAHRDWRFDFAWPEQRVALELEGGVAFGGRHSSVGGMEADMAKYNEAAIRGWIVLRVFTSKARSARILGYVSRALRVRGFGKVGA